jgi:hypothetical protein
MIAVIASRMSARSTDLDRFPCEGRTLEPISKSIFEAVGLAQRGLTHGKRSNLAENARVDLSLSYARARSKRRLLILR